MNSNEYARAKTMYALKFVTKRLKNLMMDDYGRKTYLSSFNTAFEDIFAMKKFGSILASCYDSAEVIAIYDRFSFPLLMTICDTPKFYNAIQDMIRMDERMDEIKERVRKDQKKGKKKNKDLVKEYEYLQELYKDTCKTLRKKLNLKSGSNYKKRYVSAKDIVDEKKRGYFFDDDEDYDSIGFDSNDDDSEESQFERYFNIACNKINPPRKTPKPSTAKSIYEDDDDDDDSDDDDDDDDSDGDEDNVFADEFNKKLDALTKNVNTMAVSVQMLVNDQADINQSESFVAKSIADKMQPMPDSTLIEDMTNEIEGIKKVLVSMNKSNTALIENVDNINEFLDTLYDVDGVEENTLDSADPNCSVVVCDMPNDAATIDNSTPTEQLIETVNTKPVNMSKGSKQKSTTKAEKVVNTTKVSETVVEQATEVKSADDSTDHA